MIAFCEECGKVREEICAEKIFVEAGRFISRSKFPQSFFRLTTFGSPIHYLTWHNKTAV